MAKTPKTPASKTPARKPAASGDPALVEDAVVIEEIAAEPKAGDEPAQPDEPPPPPPPPPEPAEPARPPESEPSRPGPTIAPVASQPPARRGGLGALAGLVLGGAAAALIGFVAARYVVPEGWPFPGTGPEVDPMIAVVEAQGTALAALGERISAIEADTALAARLDGLAGELGALSAETAARLDALGARIDESGARLDAVEKLAPEGSAAAQLAAEAYARELAALREMFATELEAARAAQVDAATLQADAAAAAQAAAGRAAMARVTAALDSGAPYGDALDELAGATGLQAPAALSGLAAEGVPTLAALQSEFPPAARAALDAAIRAAVEAGTIDRMTGFLRLQLGTRSLEPTEGDDPDAVLSRAEAALRAGDLGTALGELGAMPEASTPALAGWIARAEARKAALEASATLAQELNAK